MKIQIVSLTKSKYGKIGRWHNVPRYLKSFGHEIKYNKRSDAWRFYFDYLSFKPDVVVSVGLIGGIVGLLKKIGLIRRKYVFDWNDFLTEINGKNRGIAKAAFLEYAAVSGADKVVTPSKYLKSICGNLGKECVFLANGVKKDFKANKKIKLPGKNKTKILYIGTISKYKGTDELIDAVKGLKCDLIVLGETNLESRDNVYFLGQVDVEEVPDYIAAADICIDWADQDSTLKVGEYAKLGAVILGRRGRKNYVLEHGEDAYLCDNVKEGIEKLVGDKKLRDKLKKNIKSFEVDDWEEVAKKYEEILKRCVA